MTILISIFTFCASLLPHPFHVTVCEIEHDSKNNALQVSQRMFLSDLEETLNKVYDIRIDIVNPENKSYRDSLIENYVLSHLIIMVNNKPRKHTYIGHEMEGDALWCYIEYYGVKKIEELSITNTVFLDVYDDQSTILHMKYNGETKSKRLTRLKPTEQFKFE